MKTTRKAVQSTQAQINEEAIQAEVIKRVAAMLPAAVHDAVVAAEAGEVSTVAAPRAVQHGVTAPKEGGRCAAVWDRLDTMRSAGMEPTVAEVLAVADQEEWNATTTRIQYYNWRKFHGYGKVAVEAVHGDRRRGDRRAGERRVQQTKLPKGMKDRRAGTERRAQM